MTTYNKQLYCTYKDMLQASVDQQKNAVVIVDGQKELSENALLKLLDDIGEVCLSVIVIVTFSVEGHRTC